MLERMPRRRLHAVCTIGFILATACSSLAADPPDFERDIAPLLVNHCLDCHHPNKRSGKLNLSTLADILAGGEQGSALTPGNPKASLLIQRVKDGEMPPAGAKTVSPLSASQKEILAAWVATGAVWPKDRELGIHEKPVDLESARQFWSFQPVRRPAVPQVQHADRAANPIDAFVWQRLE